MLLMNASSKGQSLAEYALILALVAVASVGSLQAMGGSIQASLQGATASMGAPAGANPGGGINPIDPKSGNPILPSTPAQSAQQSASSLSMLPTGSGLNGNFAPPAPIK